MYFQYMAGLLAYVLAAVAPLGYILLQNRREPYFAGALTGSAVLGGIGFAGTMAVASARSSGIEVGGVIVLLILLCGGGAIVGAYIGLAAVTFALAGDVGRRGGLFGLAVGLVIGIMVFAALPDPGDEPIAAAKIGVIVVVAILSALVGALVGEGQTWDPQRRDRLNIRLAATGAVVVLLFGGVAVVSRVQDRSRVNTLLDTLVYGSGQARAQAAGGLGGVYRKRPDPRIVPALMNALNDPNPWVVRWAAIALGETGDRRAEPALRRLLSHPSRDVRYAANIALQNLNRPPGHH